MSPRDLNPERRQQSENFGNTELCLSYAIERWVDQVASGVGEVCFREICISKSAFFEGAFGEIGRAKIGVGEIDVDQGAAKKLDLLELQLCKEE